MSTKTTFKRVALVAVAALGLGVLSVAPSQAAHRGDSLTLTPVTSAITAGETATAKVNSSFTGVAAGDSITVSAIQFSPNAASGTLGFTVVDTYTSTVSVASAAAAGSATVYTGVTGNNVVANSNYTLNFVSPTTAGTYVIQVYATQTGGGGTISSSILNWTVTVAAAAKASKAITHLVKGTETATASATATDSTIGASKTASNAIVGRLDVVLQNAASATLAESYTATITGAGTLGQGTNIGSANPTGTVVGRSITMLHGNAVHIFADGTGGVGTITITNAAGAVLATKTVSFYGDPAAIVLSQRRELAPNSIAASDVVRAQVFDASGYPVNGAVVYATSSDTTIISTSYASFTTGDVTSAGVTTSGLARIALTGVKLGSASITVGLASSATDVTTTGYAIKSSPLSVKVAGGLNQLAGVNVIMDKQSYTPGSYAWVTITPLDASGVKLAPETYTVFSSAGLVASQPVESVTAGTLGTQIQGATIVTATSSNASSTTVADPVPTLDGTFVRKIKLPMTEGDFTLSWTTAAATSFIGLPTAGGVAGSITVQLANPGSQAAVDAAAEATDAANAATDAALAAADAADAATAAAEDASASVAKLSKSVTTALNNLKKQITSLTALVNKLLKR
jgi:hypothetical protein